MDIRLDGKVALVTGASRGIGQELVRQFARSGAKVVFCARRAEPLQQLAGELAGEGHDVLALAADVTQPDDVARLVGQALARHGRLDVLINNVGIAGPTKAIEDTDPAEWNDTLAGNLTSSFLCLRAAVPAMKKNSGGAVVNIGSVTGKRALPFRVGYAAAKMGIIGLTRTAAEELGPHGIRVNCICPGAVDGERLDEIIAGQAAQRGATAEQIKQAFQGFSPLKALVQADDVAHMALFLASDRARHMTGQDINVTAGIVMY
ncbi:SDR family NAD(P)-dependent oxidoreductase [Ottowia sp.]|uniref:SDR family NAD(P)-dependent oxidoreductase n=1 Tax=Ottowia sp. TaxID=1898956 RepID=UPI0039E3E784